MSGPNTRLVHSTDVNKLHGALCRGSLAVLYPQSFLQIQTFDSDGDIPERKMPCRDVK